MAVVVPFTALTLLVGRQCGVVATVFTRHSDAETYIASRPLDCPLSRLTVGARGECYSALQVTRTGRAHLTACSHRRIYHWATPPLLGSKIKKKF